MIAALSAVLIGVCALGVSLYQASIMREQSMMMREEQRASVWPNIAVENSYTGESFQLRVVNTGVGPARIGPVRMTLDREPIQTWTDLILKAQSTRQIRYYQSKVGNRVLPAGDFEKIFEVSDPAVADSVRRTLDRLVVEICYCSIYDDCWLYVQGFTGEDSRETVEQCRATDVDFLQ